MTEERVRIERDGIGPKANWRIVEVVGRDSSGTEHAFDWGYRFETRAAAVKTVREQCAEDPEHYADALEAIRDRFGIGWELKTQE
jgi:hypothetical protein